MTSIQRRTVLLVAALAAGTVALSATLEMSHRTREQVAGQHDGSGAQAGGVKTENKASLGGSGSSGGWIDLCEYTGGGSPSMLFASEANPVLKDAKAGTNVSKALG
jgi:hypothetical protein